MAIFLKKSLASGRQYIKRNLSANQSIAKGDVVIDRDMLGIALDRAGGTNVVAAARAQGIHIPSECAIMIEHEHVIGNKVAAVAINLGDRVYYDAVNNEITPIAGGNMACGFCIRPAAANDETVEFYFNGVQADFTVANNELRSAAVDLTAQQIKALRATPFELVPAPGAGVAIEFVRATLHLTAGTEILTENGANLEIKYKDGTGVAVSDTIESTGFIDQAANMITSAVPVADAIVIAANAANRKLVLHNIGAGEIAGNASNDAALRVNVAYRLISLV